MEEKKKILAEYMQGTKNENNVADAFSIDLSNENAETKMRDVLDKFYSAFCEADAKGEGYTDAVVTEYIPQLEELSTPSDKAEPQPKMQTSDKGTYHGIFLAPLNHLQRITDALTEMSKTDEELAKAIAEGKKTFEGCDRFIRNNMKDLAREIGKQEIAFDDDAVHTIARWYMINPDAVDVQNAVKQVKESKPKAEKKPKAQKKEKEFAEKHSYLFNIHFDNGHFKFDSLDSVEAYRQEGKMMHHCIYRCKYP